MFRKKDISSDAEMQDANLSEGLNLNADKKGRVKKLRSQLLLKHGAYSVAITAVFVAAVIVFNVLVSALSKRFDLEFDLSADKISTVTKENIDYIKNIKQNVNVIVCASKENYAAQMMQIQQELSISGNYVDYYNQTLKLINKYHDYNKKINIEFVDMYEDSKFDAISQKYANENLAYGDIIVSTVKEMDGKETERFKVIKYGEIYNIKENTSDPYSQMMGIKSYNILGNNIETALTSGIAYILGNDTKRVAILTGHSDKKAVNYAIIYEKLLKENGFEVDKIDDSRIGTFEKDTDLIVIMAPINDFLPDEIQIMNDFLENNGSKGKGLIYFGSSTCPVLPNLRDFLKDWGINILDGKLYMTDEKNILKGDPFTARTPVGRGILLITSSNQPITVDEKEKSKYSASAIKTPNTAVIAPTSADAYWKDYKEEDISQYAVIAQSTRKGFDKDNQEVLSAVMAFSSLDFITSEYAEQQNVYNKNMTLSLTKTAVQAEKTGIEFVSKQIKNESFSGMITEKTSDTVRTVFMVVLPLIILAAGIIIFIRRKNA